MQSTFVNVLLHQSEFYALLNLMTLQRNKFSNVEMFARVWPFLKSINLQSCSKPSCPVYDHFARSRLSQLFRTDLTTKFADQVFNLKFRARVAILYELVENDPPMDGRRMMDFRTEKTVVAYF